MGVPDVESTLEAEAATSTPWYRTKTCKLALAGTGVACIAALAVGLGVGIPMANKSSDSQQSVLQEPSTTITTPPTTTTTTVATPTTPPPMPPTVAGATRNIISEVYASPDDIIIPAPRANYTTCAQQYSGVGSTFIELYNPTGLDMDMSGYFLKTASNVTFRFPIPTTFKADSYLVLRHRLYNGPGTAYTFDGTLDQNNDTIVIEDANGQVVDQLTFTDVYPWPEGAGKDASSLERVLFTRATDAPANWRASKVKGGTPGGPNSVSGAGGISYIKALTITPEAPSSSESVEVSVSFDSPIDVQSVSLWYEVAERSNVMVVVPMTITGGTASATIPPKPSGSLVRFNFAIEYANGYQDTVPFNDDLYPFRSYFVYDTPSGLEDQNHIWLFGYARTVKADAPVSRLTSPPRPISGCVIKLGSGAPKVFDGAAVKLSKQKNYKVKFLPSNRFALASKIKIAPEPLTSLDWGVKFSPMIEYMGFQFFKRLGDIATPWSDVFIVHWGQGAAPSVQAVIQEVNDGMLNQNGLPDGEPLLKASYADKNPDLDSCYEATENAPLPGNQRCFNDADLYRRFARARTYAELQSKVNTSSFAAFVTGGVILANWDGFWNNHFIAVSPVDGKLTAVPWDFDHVFGYVEVSVPEEFRAGFPFTYPAGNEVKWKPYFGTNRVFEALCNNDGFQKEVLRKVQATLESGLLDSFAGFVDATADRMTAMAAAAGQAGMDSARVAATTIAECRDKTKRYLANTKTYITGQLARGRAVFYT